MLRATNYTNCYYLRWRETLQTFVGLQMDQKIQVPRQGLTGKGDVVVVVVV